MILPAHAPTLLDARLTQRYSEATIPTEQGPVKLVVYRERVRGKPDPQREHVAMVIGHPDPDSEVLVRVHSECITSEVFGSQKCDCRQQLDAAVSAMHRAGQGVVLYLRQEGRGIGLGNKIRAYALQERGADTIQANHALGFDTDLRRYDIAACMLKDLGLTRVQLMTNNPDKIAGLEDLGVQVVRRVPCEVDAHAEAQGYLRTKREQLGHLLESFDLK